MFSKQQRLQMDDFEERKIFGSKGKTLEKWVPLQKRHEGISQVKMFNLNL